MSTAQAYQTLLGAAAVIVALIAQSMVSRRFQRQKIAEVVDKVDEVQTLVNGTHVESLERVEQLAGALTEAGVAVPPHPAKEEA